MDPTPEKSSRRWSLLVALVGVLVIVAMVRWRLPVSVTKGTPPASGISSGVVTLLMQRDVDGTAETIGPDVEVPWQEGLTVLAATRQAEDLSPGWRSRWQGEGAMALLVELGGQTNEGADGLNWQYDLNGQYGKRGAGQTRLRPGDHLLWRLAPYE